MGYQVLKIKNSSQFKSWFVTDQLQDLPNPDSTKYEWVFINSIPANWEQEILIPPQQKIREIFQRAVREKPALVTPRLQKDLLKMAEVINRALELGLNEAAREAIREPAIHPDLEPYRTEMLNAIP